MSCEDEQGKIGKQEMKDAYIEMFKDKKFSVLQMISALKDKKIEYKNDTRSNGVKGCLMGYPFRDETSDAVKYSGSTEKEKQSHLAEIERLKKELADLKKACNLENAPIAVEVKKIVMSQPKKIFKDDNSPSKSESLSHSKKGKMNDHISSLDDLFMSMF